MRDFWECPCENLRLISFGDIIPPGPRVKAKEGPKWGIRYPKSDPGREALTAPGRRRLVDLHRRIRTSSLRCYTFPIEDYIDVATINDFLGKRDQGESPVVAVLGNTYYTLNYCRKKNGRGLRCYTSLLYLWMTTHLFHSKGRTEENGVPTEKSINWYPRWNEREDVIIKCRGFSNVPLVGTQGAINYNPTLTLRQAEYPMVLPPSEEAITPFVIHSLGAQHGVHLRKIQRAWKNIIRKGPEWEL
ncbi:hypothetical protein CR513_03487, partial [Mucuna pruriens]